MTTRPYAARNQLPFAITVGIGIAMERRCPHECSGAPGNDRPPLRSLCDDVLPEFWSVYIEVGRQIVHVGVISITCLRTFLAGF